MEGASCALHERPGHMMPELPGSVFGSPRHSQQHALRRSLVRARADSEAMEARAHQAESAEASLAAELRNAEAQSLSSEGLVAKCATLEERLSEMRAEQVSHWPDSVLPCLVSGAAKRQADITFCPLPSKGRLCRQICMLRVEAAGMTWMSSAGHQRSADVTTAHRMSPACRAS